MNIDVHILSVLSKTASEHVMQRAKRDKLPPEIAAFHMLNEHFAQEPIQYHEDISGDTFVSIAKNAVETEVVPEVQDAEEMSLEKLFKDNTRAFNTLTKNGVESVPQLLAMTLKELGELNRMGAGTLSSIENTLAEYDLDLADPIEEEGPLNPTERVDAVAAINDLDTDPKTFFKEALKIYCFAWSTNEESGKLDFKEFLAGVYDHKKHEDTIEDARYRIIQHLPVPLSDIKALADEAGTDAASEVMAAIGRELDEGRYKDMNALKAHFNDIEPVDEADYDDDNDDEYFFGI